MRNADELDEQSWVMPSHRRLTGPGPGRGRIRYAYGDAAPGTGQPWAGQPWVGAPPVTAPHADMWVLVCGGIAATAAFAAAFFASGGAGHAATPQTAVHTITVQACPTAAPGR